MDEIRKAIGNIEKSAEKLKTLAKNNNAIRKNAEIILTFIYILKFITPTTEKTGLKTSRRGKNHNDKITP
jgi:hypothetical protein